MLVLHIIGIIFFILLSLVFVEFLMIVIDSEDLEDMYEKRFWWVKHILGLVFTLAIDICMIILSFM